LFFSFSKDLCLNENDKIVLISSNPYQILKKLFDSMKQSSTATDVINSFNLIKIVIQIVHNELKSDRKKNRKIFINDSIVNLKEALFSSNRDTKLSFQIDFDRFLSFSPNEHEKSSMLLYRNALQTVTNIYLLQLTVSKFFENIETTSTNCYSDFKKKETITTNKWILNFLPNINSIVLNMVKQLLTNFDNDEVEIK
jgi:hypothetical protein